MSELTLCVHITKLACVLMYCVMECSLTVGAAVRLTGSWVSSPGASQSHELHVDQVKILGPSDAKVRP